MREIVKYLLGITIILTIGYTVFISYNVFKFVSSSESSISISDYEYVISLKDSEIQELEERFNGKEVLTSTENIIFNYDGTPIAWVIEISQEDNLDFDEIKNLLLENGFISFEQNDSLFIGPYIDKDQLQQAKIFLSNTLLITTGEIVKWKI